MAYLTDFLALSFATELREKVLAGPEFKEWSELREQCDMMIERGYFDGRGLADPEKRVLVKEKRLISTIWKKYRFVPVEMQNSVLGEKSRYGGRTKIDHHVRDETVDHLVDFVDCPQVSLAEIRDAAEKLSLMVLPVQYVDVERIDATMEEFSRWGNNISYEIRSAKNMIAGIEPYTKQDFFVLCPISLYDLVRAETDTEQREVVFGGELKRTKLTLDTILQIQRNLFAILRGNEGDTAIWEFGEGAECSQRELMHLRVIVETIMPIQHDLLKIAKDSEEMQSWEKKMRTNHLEETSKILREASQQLSWMKMARKLLSEKYAEEIKDSRNASWVLPEAAAMTSIMLFALPHDTSVKHSDGFARVIKYFGVDMPEAFYLNRGCVKRQNEEKLDHFVKEIRLSL